MYKKLQIFTLLILTLLACEKQVVLDLADQAGTYLVVEANITNESRQQWIRLSYTTSYYDVNQGEPASDAVVRIIGENHEYNFLEYQKDSMPGYYFNNGIGLTLTNETYELIIEHQGRTYTATSELKTVPELDSITVQMSVFSELGFSPDIFYQVLAHFEESDEKENFYLFNLYLNRRLRTVRATDKETLSNQFLDKYVSWAAVSINEKELTPGDTLTLEIRSISRENFDFYNIFFVQTSLSGNPFAGAPPANIPTNLSEGAKGFFQISAVNRQSVIYKPEELENTDP
jgi:hypothetical protein